MSETPEYLKKFIADQEEGAERMQEDFATENLAHTRKFLAEQEGQVPQLQAEREDYRVWIIDKLKKYMNGEPSGYFHHKNLIENIETVYTDLGKDIGELDAEIPNWRGKAVDATLAAEKKESH